ncbi:transglycosylase SLT domain-containing protein [Moraxella sp. ZY200743]|uniref:lytic transglycosylase domain-containing protein n=1 Tax=Moraxella sp. ZY200743 TaxID=2911970 RepID=UPI003D7C6328
MSKVYNINVNDILNGNSDEVLKKELENLDRMSIQSKRNADKYQEAFVRSSNKLKKAQDSNSNGVNVNLSGTAVPTVDLGLPISPTAHRAVAEFDTAKDINFTVGDIHPWANDFARGLNQAQGTGATILGSVRYALTNTDGLTDEEKNKRYNEIMQDSAKMVGYTPVKQYLDDIDNSYRKFQEKEYAKISEKVNPNGTVGGFIDEIRQSAKYLRENPSYAFSLVRQELVSELTHLALLSRAGKAAVPTEGFLQGYSGYIQDKAQQNNNNYDLSTRKYALAAGVGEAAFNQLGTLLTRGTSFEDLVTARLGRRKIDDVPIEKALFGEGVSNAASGGYTQVVNNLEDDKPLLKGVGQGALTEAYVGGIIQAPVLFANKIANIDATDISDASNAVKDLFTSDTQKLFNKYQSEVDNELKNSGIAIDEGNTDAVTRHRQSYDKILNKATSELDKLKADYENEQNPKKKAKLKKDINVASKSIEEMTNKRDAYFSQFDNTSSTVDTVVDGFIQARQTLNNIGLNLASTGVSVPNTPVINTNTGTSDANYTAHDFKDVLAQKDGTTYGKSLGFKTNFKADALAGGVTKADTLGFAKVLDDDGLGGLMKNFSAFNDGYHKGSTSKHTQGVKFDLSLTTDNLQTYKQTKARIEQLAKEHGYVVKVVAEHKDGASQGLDGFKWFKTTTGNHFDIEVLGRVGSVGGTKSTTTTEYKKSKDLNLGSTQYDALIKEIYTKYGYTEQEQRILKAQLAQESNFNPNAQSSKGAKGIAQFLDGTAKQYGVDVNDVASSIDGQARYMRDLLKKSNGNWEMALAFYNAGAGSTDAQTRFNKVKNYKETHNYYNNILANAGVNPDTTNDLTDSHQISDDPTSRLKELQKQLLDEDNQAKQVELQAQIDELQAYVNELENPEQTSTEQTQEQTQEQTESKQTTANQLTDLIRYSREMNDEHINRMVEAGVLSDDEIKSLRQLSKVNQLANENKTGDTVVSDIYKGSVGHTAEESNRGLLEYQQRLLTGISANDTSSLAKLADDLYTWEASHTSKAFASQEAYEMFKQTGNTYTVARDSQSNEWKIYEGEFTPAERKKYGAITINNKSARYVENVTNEAAHIQQMASAYHNLLKDDTSIPARRLADLDLIDFDSINTKPVNINAQNLNVITRHGESSNTKSNTNTPSEPIVARSSSKADDIATGELVAQQSFKDYNPQVNRQYKTVQAFKTSNDGSNPNSVWVGRDVTTDKNNKTKYHSISHYLYNGARKNDEGTYTAVNNVMDEAGNITAGAFGFATNIRDSNNYKHKPDRYNIVHDGTNEGRQSAFIEQANRFTDMIRVAVKDNPNYANALVSMATNPQLQLYGNNYSTNKYSEASVLKQLLPVVADAIKGYDSPIKQQQQITKALDSIGTFMSDGTYHADVPRVLTIDANDRGANKIKYDNNIIHTAKSYQSVYAGDIQASGTFTPADTQNANTSNTGDATGGITDTPQLAQDAVIHDDSNAVDNPAINPTNQDTVQIADENTVFDLSGFDTQVVQPTDNTATTDTTVVSEDKPQRLSAIPTNLRRDAKTKPATKMGMTAIADVLNQEQAIKPVQPQLKDVLHKTVNAKQIADIINPVKPVEQTTKGNTHPQAIHHAEIQSIIETLDKYNPDMKVKVVNQSHKHLSDDNGVIHLSADSKDIHTDLARGMLKQSLSKIADEMDELTDEAVEVIRNTQDTADLDDTQKEALKRGKKIANLRNDVKYVGKQINKYLRDNINNIDKDVQTKLMYSVMNPSTTLSQGLLDKDVKEVLKSIKIQNRHNSKIKNAYQALKSAVSKYLGFSNKQQTAYEKLLDVLADSIELSVADGVGNFIKSTDAKLSVFQSEVDIQAEHNKALKPVKDKITDTKNVLTTYFKQDQSKNKPLSMYSNFVDNLLINPVKAALKMGIDVPNQAQSTQLKDFWTFHHEFKDYLQDVVAKKTQGYEFASMASYFLDENNQVDENLLGALSYTVYDYIIANGNHTRHTDDEIKQLLGLYDEEQRKSVYLTKQLRDTYQHRGFVYDIQAQKIGERVAKTLNISANELGSMELDSRLYSALGGWAISAMQAADLIHITQMNTKEHLTNMAQVNLADASIELDKVSEHATTRFMAISDLSGKKVNPRLKQIIDTNKATSGYLSDIFGGVSAKRQPLTKAPQKGKVKRSIKGTKAQVADVQAQLVDKSQQEPMVVNEEFNHVIETLLKDHEESLLQTIGAKVTADKLAKAHINDRAGMLGSADGVMRDLTNATSFFAGLVKQGGVRQFWDTMFMAKNTRMHLNSNVVNIQSSKLHRAWADLASYKTTIKLSNNKTDTLASMLIKLNTVKDKAKAKDFNKDELRLMIFLRALGENMEGSENFIETVIKQDEHLSQIFKEGFTVDKLPSYVFIPLFLDYLNQEHIKQATDAMTKVLASEKISKAQMSSIQTAVSDMDMNASSLRALMEWSRYQTAVNGTDGSFTHSLGLGSDGINNGVMLAHVNTGTADEIMQLRTGLFSHDSGYDNYQNARHNPTLGDYYTEFKNRMVQGINNNITLINRELANPSENADDTARLQSKLQIYIQIQSFFKTLDKRKSAKDVLVPVNYGSGETSTINSVYHRFLADIQDIFADIANKAKEHKDNPAKLGIILESDVVPLVKAVNTLLGKDAGTVLSLKTQDGKDFILSPSSDLTKLSEVWFSDKDILKMNDSFTNTHGNSIWHSLEVYEGDFLEANKRNIRMLQASAQAYIAEYDIAYQNMKDKKLKQLIQKYQDLGLDGKSASIQANNELEFVGLTYTELAQLESSLNHLLPKVHTPHSIETNDEKAKIHLINTVKQTVSGNSELTQNNFYMMNEQGMLQSTTASSATKKMVIETAARVANSIQTQSQDSRISSLAMAGTDVIHSNVHDANIGGGNHYVDMAIAQNKAAYDVIRKYSSHLESLSTLMDKINEYAKHLESKGIDKNTNEVFVDMLSVAYNSFGDVREGDDNRQTIMLNLKAMHQYSGEFGSYDITQDDLQTTIEIFKKTNERFDKLYDTLTGYATAFDVTKHHEDYPKANSHQELNLIAVTDNKYGIQSVEHIVNQANRYDFSGSHINHTSHANHQDAYIENNARKFIGHKRLKQLDKERFIKGKAGNDARSDYSKLINIANQMYHSDAVYVEDAFYFDKNDKFKLSHALYTAKDLAFKMNKPLYAAMGSQWYKYDPIKRDWIQIDTPALAKNSMYYSESKYTHGLDSLLQQGIKPTTTATTNQKQDNQTVEQSKPVVSRVGKTFNHKDIEKVFKGLKAKHHSKQLFNALFTTLVKQKPDIQLQFVADANFNGKYQDGVITLNEAVWTNMSDNEKVRLLNHEISHAVTIKGLEHTEHQAVKDLKVMYKQLKQAYQTKGYKEQDTVLKQIFEPEVDKDTSDELKDMLGLAELIAYGMENKAVADFIKAELNLTKAGIKVKKKLTFFEQFWAAVQSMLSKIGFNTNYTTFLANIEKVIELNGSEIQSNLTLDFGDTYNKNMSEQDIIKEYDNKASVNEVFGSIYDETISSEHSQRLQSLMNAIYTPAYESIHVNEDEAVRLYNNQEYIKAPATLFNLSPKEAHAYSALATSMEHLFIHHNDNQAMIELKDVVAQMVAYFDDVHKLYPEYDSMTEIEKQRADRQYGDLFHDVNSNEATARIIALVMTSESMKQRLNIKVDKTSHIKNESWFDKFMSMVFKALNLIRDKFIYKSDTSSDALAELAIKLAKIDANIRADKMNMVDTMFHWAYIKPMNFANKVVDKVIDTALDKASALDDKSAIGRYANLVKNLRDNSLIDKKDGTQADSDIPTVKEVTQKSLNMTADSIATSLKNGGFDELGSLFQELRGQYNTATGIFERLVAYNNVAQKQRVSIKDGFIELARQWFGKDLEKPQKESITRHLLLTDAQTLLNYHSDKTKVKELITSKAERALRRSELESKLKQLVPEQHILNDMKIQIKNLGYYMSNETTTPNLLKSAEMIAVSVGTPWAKQFEDMDKDVFETVDELVTLYALDTVKSKYSDDIKDLMFKHEEAIFKVLQTQRANVRNSKEEFKDNPLNYNKGYIPAIHDARTDIKAVSEDDISKYIKEGYELVDLKPLPKDSLDPTNERYLMVNKNYAATRRVSGATDLLDTHNKGTEVLHYKKHGKEIANIAKEQLNLRIQLSKMNPDEYNPKDYAGSNLIAVAGTDSRIISYQYEMEGTTRDSILKRDLSFDLLMGTQMAALEVNPQIKNLQQSLGKTLVDIANDPVEGFKARPDLYKVLTPNSKDEEVQDILRLLPYPLRKELEAGFGKGKPIIIPKHHMNVIFGFKKWTVAEWFDIASEERNFFQRLITSLYEAIYDNQAKNKAHEHQLVWEWFSEQAKNTIVIRSIKVLWGNIRANLMYLALQGITPTQMARDITYAWREGKRYNKWVKDLTKVQIELQAYQDNPNKVKELQAKLKKLEYQIQSSGMHKYMQEGIMSTLVEGEDISSKNKVFKTDFETKLDKLGNKIPTPIRTVVDWAILAPNTKGYQFLSEMTQFSDMAAKYTLARHIEKQQLKQGKNAKEAFMAGIFAAQEAFINYDLPTGRTTQALNDLAVLNFTKFVLRFQKAIAKQLYTNTGHVLAQHYLAENILGTQGVLNPFLPVPNVGWGVGTIVSSPSMLPIAELF